MELAPEPSEWLLQLSGIETSRSPAGSSILTYGGVSFAAIERNHFDSTFGEFIRGFAMNEVKVGSREYKIMLKPSRFGGDLANVLRVAASFWREAVDILGPVVLNTSGDLNKVQADRLIRFFDTSSHHLNRNYYCFRERADPRGKTREVTLKFRHPDRFIARDRDMRSDGKGAKTKFEEDIKPPFQQLYSYSTTQPLEVDRKIETLKNVIRIFPGLKSGLTGFLADEPLTIVENFTAHEVVVGGAALKLSNKYDVSASCVLVIWHDEKKQGEPVVAEFSFKYGDNREDYGGGTVRRAFDVFQSLQTRFGGWMDPDSKTKTAFVYG